MDAYQIVKCKDYDDWLAARDDGVMTASELPNLFELGYDSAFTTWHYKKGKLPRPDLSKVEAVRWGTRLEKTIRSAYAEETGYSVSPPMEFALYVSRKWNWLACTPDAFQNVDGRLGVLEIKNIGSRNASDWVDGAPEQYRIQLQAQLAVTGLEIGTICALLGGQRLVWFDYPRSDKMIDLLQRTAREFLSSTNPPAIDGSSSTYAALRALYPEDVVDRVTLTDAAVEAHSRLAEIDAQIAQLKTESVTQRNLVLEALRDAATGIDPATGDVLFTYKTSQRKAYTVEAKSYRTLRRKERKHDPAAASTDTAT